MKKEKYTHISPKEDCLKSVTNQNIIKSYLLIKTPLKQIICWRFQFRTDN
jgi:hypothetical protein